MSKLGLHIHSWNNRILDYCKNVGGAVHFILDPNEIMINEVKAAQPKSLLIFRLWVPHQPLDNPIKNAREFTDLLLLYMDGCRLDGASGYNEWDGDLGYGRGGPEGLENWKRYADFEAERSRILHREGLKSVVGGCSVGTPPEHWFSHFKPALQEGDFLHLHEYSAPRMWDAVNWHCLKYRHVYEYLKKNGLPMLPLIISECGVDGGVCGVTDRSKAGWRGFGLSPGQYMEDWRWIDGEWAKNWYLVGGCAFDCGPTPEMGWGSFKMDPEMLAQWAPYVRAKGVSYWEPNEEEPMGVWENVEKHRPDVAKFKEQIGKATRDHHVPIPNYQGQPVSPAKVMAVIIANEKNPCDPNFINEFDEKKDGKPTGRKLHAVGLCGVVAEHTGLTIEELKDPLTNIKAGLSTLEGKLNVAQGNIREAYYYYTGGPYWESKDWWCSQVWLGRFCYKYSLFWGVDLELGEAVDWKKKYEDLRNGAVAAINTLQALLDA